MVTVEINGVPESFSSLDEKLDFLDYLYPQLIDLADSLGTTTVTFIVKRTYH